MSPEGSAEFYRGAVEALGEATGAKVGACWSPSLNRQQQIRLWDGYRTLLAEAEASEASVSTAAAECPECEGHGDPDWEQEEAYPTPCGRCGGEGTIPKPTAAEVIASAEKALEGALALDPHCDHAYTHRVGAIWTICDDCGKEWADDKGGFKPDKPNKHILKIEEALALIAKWKEAQRLLEGQ